MTTDIMNAADTSDTMRWPRWIASTIAAWIGLIAAITVLLEPVPTVIVFGPEARLLAAIERADVQIVDARPGYAIVTSQKSGFVRDLYVSGVWLVLPRRLGGCISRRP